MSEGHNLFFSSLFRELGSASPALRILNHRSIRITQGRNTPTERPLDITHNILEKMPPYSIDWIYVILGWSVVGRAGYGGVSISSTGIPTR
jgi:hypothetical protein